MTQSHAPSNEMTEPQVNPVLHIVAPIAAIAATMVVRKAMNMAYAKVAGHEPPAPRDPAVAMTRAIAWAAVTAATAAVVEVAVYRITNQAGHHQAR